MKLPAPFHWFIHTMQSCCNYPYTRVLFWFEYEHDFLELSRPKQKTWHHNCLEMMKKAILQLRERAKKNVAAGGTGAELAGAGAGTVAAAEAAAGAEAEAEVAEAAKNFAETTKKLRKKQAKDAKAAALFPLLDAAIVAAVHNSLRIHSTPIARRELSPIVYSPHMEKWRTGTRSSKQKKKVQNQEQALTSFDKYKLRAECTPHSRKKLIIHFISGNTRFVTHYSLSHVQSTFRI